MPDTAPLPNLVEMLERSAERFASRRLFGTRHPDGWHWTSYADFHRLVGDFRSGLMGLGLVPGDCVAIIAGNRLEWAIAAHATFSLGATFVPMFESQLQSEWLYILRDSGAKACLVANSYIGKTVQLFQDELGGLEHIIDLGAPEDSPKSFRQLLVRGGRRATKPISPEPTDIGMIIYTSGTTGLPKGVRMRHGSLAGSLRQLVQANLVTEEDRSLAFLPWAHAFGAVVELGAMMVTGASIAICEDATKLPGYLVEAKPTILFAVPRIWHAIYHATKKQIDELSPFLRDSCETALAAIERMDAGEKVSQRERLARAVFERFVVPRVQRKLGGRLRFGVSGAAALSPEVSRFLRRFGIEVLEGYGLTESGGVSTVSRPGESRPGSVGRPVDGTRIALDYQAVGAGEGEGEIIIYGRGVMEGYHNLPDVTKAALTTDGGLRTGDLGRFDADGYLYITGRIKEIYKLATGRYVAPAPLEDQLQLSPFIHQCVVFGADESHNVALIVPAHDVLADWALQHDIGTFVDVILKDARVAKLFAGEIEHYSERFRAFERVHGFVLVAEPLTVESGMLTPTLKLRRAAVIEKYGPRLRALYGQDTHHMSSDL